jgi:hypothetical protein
MQTNPCVNRYREAISLLYASPILDFNGPDHFEIFVRSIVPYRLKQIRSIAILQSSNPWFPDPMLNNTPPYSRRLFPKCRFRPQAVFPIFSAMDNLRSVCLVFDIDKTRFGIWNPTRICNVARIPGMCPSTSCQTQVYIPTPGPVPQGAGAYYASEEQAGYQLSYRRWPVNEMVTISGTLSGLWEDKHVLTKTEMMAVEGATPMR